MSTFAPGMRVIIRDEEWIIKKCDNNSYGHTTLQCSALTEANIRAYEIKRSKTDDLHMPGVRLATMHRVKGLEFTCVFVVGMTKTAMPLKSAIASSDPVSKEEAINAERCLLYVALTRAKKAAYVSAYGQASEFIQ